MRHGRATQAACTCVRRKVSKSWGRPAYGFCALAQDCQTSAFDAICRDSDLPERLQPRSFEKQSHDAIAGPGLHGIERIEPASSSTARNPAIVIGAVCGLLGGLLLLAAGLLAIMARRRSTAASKSRADEGQVEKGAMPMWTGRKAYRSTTLLSKLIVCDSKQHARCGTRELAAEEAGASSLRHTIMQHGCSDSAACE